MTTRIQALAKDAVAFRLDPDSNCYEALICPEDLEVFAELLINESIKVMMSNDYHGEWLGEKIKEHFGVKE